MAAKPKFDPRKMMEKAIEVMRSSVAEKRTDGKPNPLVGAVLVRPDGSIETAARGELREGNHAEFTLLERKYVVELGLLQKVGASSSTEYEVRKP